MNTTQTQSEARKARRLEQDKAWKRANPDARRSHQLRYRYGITLEDRNAMIVAQGFKCAICATDTPSARGWMVDHCHATKRVRGILCDNCNRGLGHFKDNTTSLSAAIAYLGNDPAIVGH